MALPKEPKLEHQRQLAAEDDFRKEVKSRCIWGGAEENSITKFFAKAAGVQLQSGYNYINDPGRIRVGTMQKIVKNLKPDIGVILRLLGYTNNEIKSYAKTVLQ